MYIYTQCNGNDTDIAHAPWIAEVRGKGMLFSSWGALFPLSVLRLRIDALSRSGDAPIQRLIEKYLLLCGCGKQVLRP